MENIGEGKSFLVEGRLVWKLPKTIGTDSVY